MKKIVAVKIYVGVKIKQLKILRYPSWFSQDPRLVLTLETRVFQVPKSCHRNSW